MVNATIVHTDQIEVLGENKKPPFALRQKRYRASTKDALTYKRELYERRLEGLRELTRLTELYGGYETE